MIKKLFFAVFFLLCFTVGVHAETASNTNILPNDSSSCTSPYTTSSVPGVGCSGSAKQLNIYSPADTTNQGFDVRDGGGYEFGSGGSYDIEADKELTIGSAGSLENITVTKETGGTTTTTTDMLDGGVTLKSTTEVQNCEWQGSAYQCGNARTGTDSWTVRVQIKDAAGNVLATVEQTRNTDASVFLVCSTVARTLPAASLICTLTVHESVPVRATPHW